MGSLLNIVTPLHKRTARNYVARMTDDKIHCMEVAKRYDQDYWDGDRRYGYGGYRYDGRWGVVAEGLIKQYGLKDDAAILDVGCGKGFLLHELKTRLPRARISGFDISDHGLKNAKPEVQPYIFPLDAGQPYPFAKGEFDLVISLGTLHNLPLPQLKIALVEIARVGKAGYVMVESYRNDAELFNLQCWALTCATFLRPADWTWLFAEFGYGGDYEFIYFE